MNRMQVGSGVPWEASVGYCKAVRVGPHIYVSGTAGVDAHGAVVGRGDPYAQTRQALAGILAALGEVGARAEHVVRTRMYLTDINQWEEVGRAHGEVFGEVRPATTMLQVAKMISPDMVVQIEADAYVPAG